MPPKGKDAKGKGGAPEPEEKISAGDYLQEDREKLEQEECIHSILNDVIYKVFHHAEETYLQGMVPTYTVDRLLNDALAVVDLAFVPREDHCLQSLTSVGNNWEIDDEPQPCPIDRWARGQVPTKMREKPVPGKTPDGPPTPKSRHGHGFQSGRNSAAPSVHSQDDRRLTSPSKTLKRGTTPMAAIPVIRPEGKKKLTPEEAEREQRLREELQARYQVEELQRQQLEADAEEVRKLEKFQKDLRGQDYGYDHRGVLQMMMKLDVDKLPDSCVDTNTALLKTPEELAIIEAQIEAAKAAKARAGKPGEKKKKPKEVVEDPNKVPEFIRAETEAQKSMMETMKMSAGVTLKENGAVKPGPKELPLNDNMSRKEFISLLMSQKSSGHILDSRPSTEQQESTGPGLNNSGPRKSMRESQRLITPDWTADAVPIVPQENPVRVPKDINEVLIKAPDWGDNPQPKENRFVPPAPAFKPSGKQLQATLGNRSFNPRDRPFITATGQKKSGTFVQPVSPTILTSPPKDEYDL